MSTLDVADPNDLASSLRNGPRLVRDLAAYLDQQAAKHRKQADEAIASLGASLRSVGAGGAAPLYCSDAAEHLTRAAAYADVLAEMRELLSVQKWDLSPSQWYPARPESREDMA